MRLVFSFHQKKLGSMRCFKIKTILTTNWKWKFYQEVFLFWENKVIHIFEIKKYFNKNSYCLTYSYKFADTLFLWKNFYWNRNRLCFSLLPVVWAQWWKLVLLKSSVFIFLWSLLMNTITTEFISRWVIFSLLHVELSRTIF